MAATRPGSEFPALRLIAPWLPGSLLARQYLFAGLAVQFILAVALLQLGGVFSLFVPLLGAVGLIFRWTAIPIIVLVLFGYCLLFPDGDPFLTLQSEVPGSHFRMLDLALCSLLMVSMYCHYSYLSLSLQAMPEDPLPAPVRPGSTVIRGKTTDLSRPIIRPSSETFESEFLEIVAVVAIAVLLAQLAWYGLTHLAIDFRENPPLRWITDSYRTSRTQALWPTGMSPAIHRMLIFAALVLIGGIGCWFVFWYWRPCLARPLE